MTNINATALSRVTKGAAFLDSRSASVLAPNWRSRINVDTLAVWSTVNCPLGQLYSDYYTGKNRLNLTSAQCEQYGFCEGGEGDDYVSNEQLTEAWKHLLSAPKKGEIYVDTYGDGFKIEAVIDREDGTSACMVTGGTVKAGRFVAAGRMYSVRTESVRTAYKLHTDPSFKNGDMLVGSKGGKDVVLYVRELGKYHEVLVLHTTGALGTTLTSAELNYGPLKPLSYGIKPVNAHTLIV